MGDIDSYSDFQQLQNICLAHVKRDLIEFEIQWVISHHYSFMNWKFCADFWNLSAIAPCVCDGALGRWCECSDTWRGLEERWGWWVGGVRQTEQCKACSSCAEMEEVAGLEALLRQSMKVGERLKRAVRQQKQRTRETEGGRQYCSRERRGRYSISLFLCYPVLALFNCHSGPSKSALLGHPSSSLSLSTVGPTMDGTGRDSVSAQRWRNHAVRLVRVSCNFGPHRCVLPDTGWRLLGKSSRASGWHCFS
jgi:hypothetical protein